MTRSVAAEEAIVLASSNSAVADYLVKRGEERNGSRWTDFSEEAEHKLLDRADRLIDLRLAEYCLHPSTARILFYRDRNDWAIRSLVLSNCALTRTSFIYEFPEHLFDGEEKLYEFLSEMTPDEAAMMFRNPTLDDSFLEKLLDLGEPWKAVKSDTRPYVLSSLAENPKLHKSVSTSDHEDGWDWYTAGKPFAAAWRLCINLEVNERNAHHLSRLYDRLAPYCLTCEGIADALPRWIPQSDEELAAEQKKNSQYRTSDYQEIRRAIAAMLLRRHEVEKNALLLSDDVAVRCGAYSSGAFTADEIEEAIAKDNWFAAQSFLRNPLCWKTADLRNQIAKGLPSDDRTAAWMYDRYAAKYEAEHPEWFDFYDPPEVEKETLLSEVPFSDFARYFRTSPAIIGLNEKITKLENNQRMLLWLLVGVIVLQLYFG